MSNVPMEHPSWCDQTSRCNDLAHLGRMIEVRSLSEDYAEIKLWLRQVKMTDAEPHLVLVSGEAVMVISLRQARALGHACATQARLAGAQ